MSTELFLRLLRRTLDYRYNYDLHVAPHLTAKGVRQVRLAVLGRHPSMPPLQFLTPLACVHRCFFQPDNTQTIAMPTNWLRGMGATEALSREAYFAGSELPGHDPELRRKLLRAVELAEYPAQQRQLDWSPGRIVCWTPRLVRRRR